MKKRILALLMAGMLTVGLAACGGETSGETEAPGGETAETAGIAAEDLKVGLILVGEAADAYNKNHIEGMQAACEALGLDYDTQVVVKTNIGEDSTCADAIGELIDAGCQAMSSTWWKPLPTIPTSSSATPPASRAPLTIWTTPTTTSPRSMRPATWPASPPV